jgi:uncharacterized protein YcbK (DUF882 family)
LFERTANYNKPLPGILPTIRLVTDSWNVPREAVAKISQEFQSLPLHLALSVRRLLSARKVCALTALGLLAAFAPAASARNGEIHRRTHTMRHMLSNIGMPSMGFISDDDEDVPEEGPKYELKLVRQGGDIIDVVYRVGDTYITESLDALSQFLRDSHNEEVKDYNPRTFDLLHTMLRKVNRPGNVIEVLCGYRTKETNDALRASGTTNAAEHSEHIEGTALDIRVPGVPAAQLRNAALSLGAGGVGYYPRGQFVHVDTGPVRKWTYTPHHRRHRRRHHT